jgi:hypothetical protein
MYPSVGADGPAQPSVGAGLLAMQAATVWTLSRASPLPKAACAATPTPTAAEIWVGAGLPAIGPCQAPPASRASPLPQVACAAMPTPMAAEIWVGAGLPAIEPCQAPPASRESPLPQAACAVTPTPTAAEIWVGAGLPAIGPCQAAPASRASPTSCLRSHAYTDGGRDLGGSPPAALAPHYRAENRAIAGRIRSFIADRFRAALRPIAAGPAPRQGPLLHP